MVISAYSYCFFVEVFLSNSYWKLNLAHASMNTVVTRLSQVGGGTF